MSLCPNCKEKLEVLVKGLKRPAKANTNRWNEEQDKTKRSWSCLNCGFHGSQTTYHKNIRKRIKLNK
jgi:hypothetical protein